MSLPKLKLNSIVTGEISQIAFGGSGLLRIDNFVLFVPYTAPKDIIEARIVELKKGYGRAELVRIISPSPFRTKPKCPYFGTCMGCQLQHLQYKTQLEIKKGAVADALQRIGKLNHPLVEIVPSEKEFGYRERITLHLKDEKLGYIGPDNKSILEIHTCPIFTDEPIIQELQKFKHAHFKKNHGRIQILKDKKGGFLVHLATEPPPSNMEKTQLEIEFRGDKPIQSEILGLKIEYSPKVFIQNNFEESIKIYSEILSIMQDVKPHKVLDLYSGIGVTSCLLAKAGMEVHSIELNPASVKYARKNAQLNNLSNIQFSQGKVEAILKDDPSFDAVILNPPREGVERQVLLTLSKMKPKTIVYISCMPSTLARDLKLLSDDYEIKIVKAFDMFPQTGHIETLIRLNRT